MRLFLPSPALKIHLTNDLVIIDYLELQTAWVMKQGYGDRTRVNDITFITPNQPAFKKVLEKYF